MVVCEHHGHRVAAQCELHHISRCQVHAVARTFGEPFKTQQTVLRVQCRGAHRLHRHAEHLARDVILHRILARKPRSLSRDARRISPEYLGQHGKEKRGIPRHARHLLQLLRIRVEHVRERTETVHERVCHLVGVAPGNECKENVFQQFVILHGLRARSPHSVAHPHPVTVMCAHSEKLPRVRADHIIILQNYTLYPRQNQEKPAKQAVMKVRAFAPRAASLLPARRRKPLPFSRSRPCARPAPATKAASLPCLSRISETSPRPVTLRRNSRSPRRRQPARTAPYSPRPAGVPRLRGWRESRTPR